MSMTLMHPIFYSLILTLQFLGGHWVLGKNLTCWKMAPGKGWALSVMTRMGKQPVGQWGASFDMPRAYSV